MGFESGGMADKLGNRYEGRWVAKQLLRLLNEEIQSVTVEPIGPEGQGVDLLVVKRNGIRRLQQCKARRGSHESWTVRALASTGILSHLQAHLKRDPVYEFALVSAIPSRTFADICESARQSNNNPEEFFQYQIQETGKERRDAFTEFCGALSLNPGGEELRTAFDLLRRIYIELYPDDRNSWQDLLTMAGLLLTGESEAAVSVLLNYVEDNDKYRKPIHADELRTDLREKHDIHPKNLGKDPRIAPVVRELQEQFAESIRHKLIGGRVIPREETEKVIESIQAEKDVVLHGAAGFGKSGVLYELTEYLNRKQIPYLPIRLDRRIPEKTATHFGSDMNLPDSPAYALAGLAADRKGILILDQLDAIRWTAAHSGAAMDVCKELLRQVRSLRQLGKSIFIIFASRTFDLENDQEIKNLVADNEKQSFAKISVTALSDDQLKTIIGSDFPLLAESQKRIIACPQNLAMWMDLKDRGEKPTFRSATELMSRFWENRRSILEKEARISAGQLDSFLSPLVDYMESRGTVSAPIRITTTNPSVQDALISYGILQKSPGRISFCHQRYLDYLIAERILTQIDEGAGSVLTWLGPKNNQSLFRREQLRQALSLLAEESLPDFFQNARELLESENVRFHLKHLVLELMGQIDVISRELFEYCTGLVNDSYWRDHILGTVFWGHSPWISGLLEAGVLQNWLSNPDKETIDRALWLLRSAAENIPDKVTEALEPFVEKGGNWPKKIQDTLSWQMANDSDRMFDLRLRLAKKRVVPDFIDWKPLCGKYPLRALQFIEAVLSCWKIEENKDGNHRNSRLEMWYDHDKEALQNAVRQFPQIAWDLLIGHIQRLTSIQTDPYDTKLARWMDNRWITHRETDIARGVVELVMLAGRTLAASKPNELIVRCCTLENSISPIIQEIIMAVYAHLPSGHANTGITWLLADPMRFQLGKGFNEPEWKPASRLIKALSPHCSSSLFRQLEKAITHYHDPDEKRLAKHYLKGWREGYFYHYWGRAQHFLLPALDPERIQPATTNLIRVLKRKFTPYPEERFLRGGRVSGGWVGSKLNPNLGKISDREWLKIVCSEKVSEGGISKSVQVSPDQILETSIRQFSGSLSQMAKRYPERFGRLALKFPDNVHPRYVSAIIEGFRKKQPEKDWSEGEKSSWQPARLETIEAVLGKYQAGDDRATAMAFCWLIYERADENWSDNTIARLLHFAQNHPDLELGKLNLNCDKSSDDASVENLFQNTINCVRGLSGCAIGQLIWAQKDRFEHLRPGIEALINDPHPAVRMAAIEAIEPVLNIDRGLAVEWFCVACSEDLRVAASPRALSFFNYIIPSHIEQVGPIIRRMVKSSFVDVAKEGAGQAFARWLFHGLFGEELAICCKGSLPQRKGVAKVVASLMHEREHLSRCLEIIHPLLNDPEKEVREEFRGVFRNDRNLNDPEYSSLLKDYIRSQAFADEPLHFILSLDKFAGSLVPLSEAILSIGDVFSTTLRKKTQEVGSRYPYVASKVPTILVRLYEQAQGAQDLQIANQCLDRIDQLFENRVGRAIELAHSIEN